MTRPTTEPPLGAAAAGPRPAPGPEWLRVGGVALAVRDLARAEAFYREVLGLGVAERTADLVRLGAGGAGFLDLLHRPTALPDDPATAGLFHTAFLLPSRADLGRWLAHAHRLRQPLDGAADHLVSEALYLSDPEGNGVEVYADRPRARWRWRDGPDGRRVEMATRPLGAEGLLAEADGAWAGAPEGTRVGHVHLRVGDVAGAVRFYGERLGMAVTAARPGAAFLSTGGYHHHVAVNAWRSAGAGRRDEARAGLAWVTLEAGDEEGLAGIARRAEAADPARGGVRDPWGTELRFRLAPHAGAQGSSHQ
jgi:catechol 2,3-dioxygenase